MHRKRQRHRTAGQSDSVADNASGPLQRDKKLDYRELEYAQHDSKVYSALIKLDGLKQFSFELFQKYQANTDVKRSMTA